jgi:hypothetical protein
MEHSVTCMFCVVTRYILFLQSFQSKLSFSSKEIVALSCSWCKTAYHNKESCFNLQKIGEECNLGKLTKGEENWGVSTTCPAGFHGLMIFRLQAYITLWCLHAPAMAIWHRTDVWNLKALMRVYLTMCADSSCSGLLLRKILKSEFTLKCVETALRNPMDIMQRHILRRYVTPHLSPYCFISCPSRRGVCQPVSWLSLPALVWTTARRLEGFVGT